MRSQQMNTFLTCLSLDFFTLKTRMEAIGREASGVMGLFLHLAQLLQCSCFSLEVAWLDVGGADYGGAVGAEMTAVFSNIGSIVY